MAEAAVSGAAIATEGLRHRHVPCEDVVLHVVEGGSVGTPTLLFLHGWPQDSTAWAPLMRSLAGEAHVLALDLPGIGASTQPPQASDKRTLAGYVHAAITALDLHEVTVVGHDVGGMVAHACLRVCPDDLATVVVMNTVIPGIHPWLDISRNLRSWHFGFHNVPGLPEALVTGRNAAYFGHFFDTLAAAPDAIAAAARTAYAQAYARPDALHAGFEWYRAFEQDERDNLHARDAPVQIPVLYLRGEHEPGDLEQYLAGFRESGLRNIRGQTIRGSGHFTPDENPEAVRAALCSFVGLTC